METKKFVVDTTLVGMTMNGLSHLVGVSCRAEFACALVRGLGGNLQEAARERFAKEVFHWCKESAPDPRRVLDTYYDRGSDRLCTYQLQVGGGWSCDSHVIVFCDTSRLVNIMR